MNLKKDMVYKILLVLFLLLFAVIAEIPTPTNIHTSNVLFTNNTVLPESSKHILGVTHEYGDLPPTTGDWYINNPTRVENRTINLNGSNIFVNSTLELINVTITNIRTMRVETTGQIYALNTTLTGNTSLLSQIEIYGKLIFNNCTISNFGYVQPGSPPSPGIYVKESSMFEVLSTVFINDLLGIYIIYSENIFINGCIFYELTWRDIEVYNTNNVTITNNLFYGIQDLPYSTSGFTFGIILGTDTTKVYIKKNLFCNFKTTAIYTNAPSYVYVIGNTFINISDLAITVNVYNFYFYLNNFYSTAYPVQPGMSNWDQSLGYGNYYSNFKGIDNNHDGIIDSSHPLSRDGPTDYYPLLYPVYYAYPEIHYFGPLNPSIFPEAILSHVYNVSYPPDVYPVNIFFEPLLNFYSLNDTVSVRFHVTGISPRQIEVYYTSTFIGSWTQCNITTVSNDTYLITLPNLNYTDTYPLKAVIHDSSGITVNTSSFPIFVTKRYYLVSATGEIEIPEANATVTYQGVAAPTALNITYILLF